ncbi:hypothetical protein GH733_010889 [Mirounga leonina]|nr:hypothetical protein GH733_010889 [Mirounga leonina]
MRFPGSRGLVCAGLADMARPAEKLSTAQSAVLMATGFIWSRYSLVIIPKNWSLFAVNFFVGAAGASQLFRIWRNLDCSENVGYAISVHAAKETRWTFITGFTAMTEKFSTAMYMDRGAEQLVEILNHYISAIVEKVLIFGGDILKFAGDALLALWKVERRQLKNIITVVIKCSLEIHGLFETQESEEGLDVRVKIVTPRFGLFREPVLLGTNPELLVLASLPALAAGHITMLVFGDETRSFFLVIGQAVDDVRLAQNMAQMNDVILSPNCWQLCDRSMIEIERIPDQRAVKVGAMLPLAESSVRLCQGAPCQEATGKARGVKLLGWRLGWDSLS